MKSKQVQPTSKSRLLSHSLLYHRISSYSSCRYAFTCHLISIVLFSTLVNPIKKSTNHNKQAFVFWKTLVCWPETSAAPPNVAFYAPRTIRVDPGPMRNWTGMVEIRKCFGRQDRKDKKMLLSQLSVTFRRFHAVKGSPSNRPSPGSTNGDLLLTSPDRSVKQPTQQFAAICSHFPL